MTGAKSNICSQGPCRESFSVVEDTVLMKLLLDKAGFVWGRIHKVLCLQSNELAVIPLNILGHLAVSGVGDDVCNNGWGRWLSG